jgi:hypothetical protein
VDILIGWPGGDVESTLRLAGFLGGSYFALIWVASVLWVYRDIRSRTRDMVSQLTATAIAVALPILGLPLYLVLRPKHTLQESYERQLEQEAMLSELHAVSACPQCRRPVQDDFMVCAHCRTQLREPCGSCGRLLQHAWRNCPYCATPRPRPVRQEEPEPASTAVAGRDAPPRRVEEGEPAAVSQRRSDRRRPTSRPEEGRERPTEEPAPAARAPRSERPDRAERGAPVEGLADEEPEALAPRRRSGGQRSAGL